MRYPLLSQVLLIGLCLLSLDCREREMPAETIDDMARALVKLSLAVGQHDPDYVDAYFGPEDWRAEVEHQTPGLEPIRRQAEEIRRKLGALPVTDGDDLAERRRAHLDKTLGSLIARVDFLSGKADRFDTESAALFDAVAPSHPAEHFQEILGGLGSILPGHGPLVDRYEAFKSDFVIPPEKLDPVFQAAIAACRDQTRRHIELPEGESFVVEYVTDKAWSAYNWYQGNYRSLIQVNTDLPIYIDRALDLACHEGYPGHHVYNLLLERELLRERGWIEYSVYPLFSPRSLIAEGTANFGIEMAFPAEERLRFEAEVLFPLAGLHPERAAEYYEVGDLVKQLSYAGNEAARGYLDGDLDEAAAIDWLITYALMSPPRARQRLAFIEQYRSYVINYNLGQDLVRRYIERLGGTPDQPERRWQLFANLLSEPYLPSQLQ